MNMKNAINFIPIILYHKIEPLLGKNSLPSLISYPSLGLINSLT
jgi:hypothetical protein